MRFISREEIITSVKELYIKANIHLPPFVESCLKKARDEEEGKGKEVLEVLLENIKMAREENIPLCQDTGMAVVFLNVGRDVRLEFDIEDAINEGIKNAVRDGYLRASTVDEPLNKRKNRGDNTPAIIHTHFVDGDRIEINLLVKGFGSENASFLFHLSPHGGWEELKSVIVKAVKMKGANACPPLFIGVGAGGTSEKALELSKIALFDESPLNKKEKEILDEINKLGIGPGGIGGKFTCLRVKVKEFPTHIAGLPVGISLNCHALRYAKRNI